MFFDQSRSATKFTNFLSHLRSNHSSLVHGDDLDWKSLNSAAAAASKKRKADSLGGMNKFVIKVNKEPVIRRSHRRTALKKKLTAAFARVSAHGPYPIGMLVNPAIEDLLIELGIVKECSDDIPSYGTVKKTFDKIISKDLDEVLKELKDLLAMYPWLKLSWSWDEWESKTNMAYVALCAHTILPDCSGVLDIPIAVKKFPFPHVAADYRNIVEGTICARLELTQATFIKRTHGTAYDGAKVNGNTFSPSPDAVGISTAEKDLREIICERYKTIEEVTCMCHRFYLL